jgi:hypothetical protein
VETRAREDLARDVEELSAAFVGRQAHARLRRSTSRA